MFGYLEGDYQVLEKKEHPSRKTKSATLHYELRQDTAMCRPPYIAIFERSDSSKILYDSLFIYDDESVAREDWKKATGDTMILISDLSYTEYIANHHIGRTKSGGVTMY